MDRRISKKVPFFIQHVWIKIHRNGIAMGTRGIAEQFLGVAFGLMRTSVFPAWQIEFCRPISTMLQN